MDFISIYTLQKLGISIIHSLWLIGLITFVYFFFILTGNKLSVNQKYTLGLISFAVVIVSFIFTFHLVSNLNSYEQKTKSDNSTLNISNELLDTNLSGKQLLESQEKTNLLAINYFKFWKVINHAAGTIGAIWILGLIFFIFRKSMAFYNLKRIEKNKYNVRSMKWEKTLKEISTKLDLKKRVKILFSPLVNSPFSFGFLKPVILFPLRITTGLSDEEIKCILIHELAHNLRNDYLYNLFQHLIETLFFYHPGIWWISKNIRTQREIICDKIVLDNEISEKHYTNTLIKLGELQISDANLAIAAKHRNNELFTRIKHIINLPDNTGKRIGNPLLIVSVVIILIMSGFVFKGKESNIKSTILSEGIETSLSPYNGSFVFYDFKQDKYFISNDSICNLRYPAYSTFKIASSLIALDMGIAKNEFYTIQYDSIKYPLPEKMKKNNFFKHWFNDHTLKTALQYSVNWYFIELGEQIGNDNMADYMEKLAYGNQIVSSGTEQAWYNGQLKISALEQVEFIKNILNQNYKGISKDAQRIIAQLFPEELENNYALYSKTGTGEIGNDRSVYWDIGYLKTKENNYAFALNIFENNANNVPWKKRMEMVQKIFADLGLIEK